MAILELLGRLNISLATDHANDELMTTYNNFISANEDPFVCKVYVPSAPRLLSVPATYDSNRLERHAKASGRKVAGRK